MLSTSAAARRRGGLYADCNGFDRDSGNEVEIRIHDNGIGMPPEVRDARFYPIFHNQADRRRHRSRSVD